MNETTLSETSLSSTEREALEALHQRIQAAFDIEALIVFGSVVRGEADDESDIDLLVITKQPFTRLGRHQITDLVFEINLAYGTNFSTLVVDQVGWEEGLFSVLPIHEEIKREGIRL